MEIRERAIDTATIIKLKMGRPRYAKGHKARPYGFVLSEQDLARLAESKIRPAAILAYAIICGAARAAPYAQWVTLRSRVREAARRDYRWWHKATVQLEVAGFIRCERHRGRLPRYQLMKRQQR